MEEFLIFRFLPQTPQILCSCLCSRPKAFDTDACGANLQPQWPSLQTPCVSEHLHLHRPAIVSLTFNKAASPSVALVVTQVHTLYTVCVLIMLIIYLSEKTLSV